MGKDSDELIVGGATVRNATPSGFTGSAVNRRGEAPRDVSQVPLIAFARISAERDMRASHLSAGTVSQKRETLISIGTPLRGHDIISANLPASSQRAHMRRYTHDARRPAPRAQSRRATRPRRPQTRRRIDCSMAHGCTTTSTSPSRAPAVRLCLGLGTRNAYASVEGAWR